MEVKPVVLKVKIKTNDMLERYKEEPLPMDIVAVNNSAYSGHPIDEDLPDWASIDYFYGKDKDPFVVFDIHIDMNEIEESVMWKLNEIKTLLTGHIPEENYDQSWTPPFHIEDCNGDDTGIDNIYDEDVARIMMAICFLANTSKVVYLSNKFNNTIMSYDPDDYDDDFTEVTEELSRLMSLMDVNEG